MKMTSAVHISLARPGRPSFWSTAFVTVFILTLALVPSGAGAGVAVTQVLATGKSEYSASAAAGWLTYSQARTVSSGPDAFARPDVGTTIKLNAPGTFGGSSSIDIANPVLGDVVVFQQWKGADGDEDIKFFDLATQTRSNAPVGVNTSKSEIGADVSGNHLVFARGPRKGNPTKVVLHDLTDDSQIVVDEADYAYPGGMSGDWVVWQRCEWACQIRRYQISTGRERVVDQPGFGTESYSPVIDDDGTVYFLRSRPACGQNVRIYRSVVGGGRSTQYYRFPDKVDAYLNEVAVVDGEHVIYFSRYTCRDPDWDVYRLPT